MAEIKSTSHCRLMVALKTVVVWLDDSIVAPKCDQTAAASVNK